MQPVLFMNLSVITDHFFFPHDISHTFSVDQNHVILDKLKSQMQFI